MIRSLLAAVLALLLASCAVSSNAWVGHHQEIFAQLVAFLGGGALPPGGSPG